MMQAACSAALLLTLIFLPMVVLSARDRRAERRPHRLTMNEHLQIRDALAKGDADHLDRLIRDARSR